ncbi:MAG: type II toxin-antitoxin system VapC family toxin [Actinomycetota bacterium]
MITAADSSVLIDLLQDDEYGAASGAALRLALLHGSLIAGEVVWAEVSSLFPDTDSANQVLDRLQVAFVPAGRPAAERAARIWRPYRESGGPRSRIVADFLIGAHAMERADALLTRDRGFYREHFEGLTVIDPTAPD